jgi:hypothetical protein
MRKRKPELMLKSSPGMRHTAATVCSPSGESVSELWGTIKETEIAAAIRRKDIRVTSPRSLLQ